jgi:hypothetical protein
LRKIIAFAIGIFEILLRFVWRGLLAGDLETSASTTPSAAPGHATTPSAAWLAGNRHYGKSRAAEKKNARNRIFLIDRAAKLAI